MRKLSKRVLAILIVACVVSSAGGCGKIAEKAAEKAVEVAVKSEGGDVDVDIDSETGQVTIKGKGADGGTVEIKAGEGGMTMQGSGDGQRFQMEVSEGQMTMTTEEGTIRASGDDDAFTVTTPEGSLTGTSGPDAQIPEDWPKSVPVYAGAKVLSTMVMAEMGIYTLELATSAGMADVVAYYKKELPAKGWTEQQSFTQGVEATVLAYMKGEQVLNVTVTVADGTTTLGLMLRKM